ncbi:MAG: ABC transporter ATP-binding protein [Actinobacteria bacterium]|nr:ABC transporter ATP-binding protein [Actinomycetota bacterium]
MTSANGNAALEGTLLAVKDLGVEIPGGLQVVTDVSLSVGRGEVVGVVGESGSGKSLTLKAIAGLLPRGVTVSAGQIAVEGTDVARASSRELRRLRGGVVGMVFQEPMTALNPTMRIGRQIAESVKAHAQVSNKQAGAKAIELLGEMGFKDPRHSADLFPHELSGGMRQRVVIAIALAGDPSLLLCDEPTTALDATVTMKVLDLILGLSAERNIGVVLVSHDLGVASRVCDRLVVMYGGRMVEEGPADEVLRRPHHPYTFALLRAVPTKDSSIDDLKAIPGAPPAAGEAGPGCPFVPRCAFAEEACGQRVESIAVGPRRISACRRQELFPDLVEAAK